MILQDGVARLLAIHEGRLAHQIALTAVFLLNASFYKVTDYHPNDIVRRSIIVISSLTTP